MASESKISTNNLSKEPLENIILRKSVSKSYSLDSLIGFRNLYLGSQIYIYDFSNWEIDTIHGYKETPLIFSKKFNSFSIDYFNVNDISIITINGIVSTIDISFGYSRTPQVKAEEIESSMDFTNMTTNLDGVYGEHISRTLIPRYFEKYHAPIWPPPQNLKWIGKQVASQNRIVEWIGNQTRVIYGETVSAFPVHNELNSSVPIYYRISTFSRLIYSKIDSEKIFKKCFNESIEIIDRSKKNKFKNNF